MGKIITRQFEVKEYHADGALTPLTELVGVYDLDAATGVADVQPDDDGIVAPFTFDAPAGTLLRFTVSGYDGEMLMFALPEGSSGCYPHRPDAMSYDAYGCTLIVRAPNLGAPAKPTAGRGKPVRAEIYAQGLERIDYLGEVVPGQAASFPYRLGDGESVALYAVTRYASGVAAPEGLGAAAIAVVSNVDTMTVVQGGDTVVESGNPVIEG